ncbi:kinase-like protein [Lojkania enalia]|uniref:Kinase-like protein n=1 Tax=Lojkania enalia TaxID=147567 RepID=A0A9P4KD51_9PLEO|nr:kinase-like protein [Didymosphaeria enalia]
MAGEVVAFFEVQLAGNDPNETLSHVEIFGNEEFYLGRNPALCRQYWSDSYISNKHLRIHCVLYEQDPIADIPPFVYATDVSTNGTYLKKSNSECSSSQGRGIRMGRNKGAFLLDNGDELQISDSVTLIYRSLIQVDPVELTPTQVQEKRLFSSRYLITRRVLGIGGYGRVMVGINQKTQRQLACKVIDLRHLYHGLSPPITQQFISNHEQSQTDGTYVTKKIWPTRVAKCFREFDILKDLTHPNIVSLEKVFWSSNTIYIFQELVTGGDLFSYLEYKGGRLCDVEAAVIVRQILKGIEYLHGHDIAHRDLKPDNILMTSLDDGARIVITDFGNARFLPKEPNGYNSRLPMKRRMFSLVGTLEYTAPEIHRMNRTIPESYGYSRAVDMWSVGAISAALLSGDAIFTNRFHPHFERDPRSVILPIAAKCDLSALDDEDHPVWSGVGFRPKDFIRKLLVLREDERMTATEALAHTWFSNKYHAAEFDALYDRAIKAWQPRRKVFRLVEPISKIPVDLATVGVSEELLSQEVLSRFFAPPTRNSSPHDIHESLSSSAQRRANPPLPSITEDDYDFDRPSQFAQQPYDPTIPKTPSFTPPFLHQDSIGNSMDQLALDSQTASIYATTEDASQCEAAKFGNTNGNDGSITYTAFNQSPHLHTPRRIPDSSLVHETPIRCVKRSLHSPSYNSRGDNSSHEGESHNRIPTPINITEELRKRRKIAQKPN